MINLSCGRRVSYTDDEILRLSRALQKLISVTQTALIICEKGACGEKLAHQCRGVMLKNITAVTDDRLPGKAPDFIVDAMTVYDSEKIKRINSLYYRKSRFISIGVPSGIDAETGEAKDAFIRADFTVVSGSRAAGLYLGDGIDAAGEIRVIDEDAEDENPDVKLFASTDIMLTPRARNIHKNSCGHLLIVAGSFGMAGAASLCAKAALRSGVGLVTVACPRSIVPILQIHAPCAMCMALPESDGAINEDAVSVLAEKLDGFDAVACGCGLSRKAAPQVIRLLLQSGKRAVFDADALNIISQNVELKALLNGNHLITPHPGEAARLLMHTVGNPIRDVRELAGIGCTAMLKNASTVIASPDGNAAYISASGCCGMARGGSGDVLTGITGALMASEKAERLDDIAAIASEIHGQAGELAQKKYGKRGMNAADIIDFLPEVFTRYDK